MAESGCNEDLPCSQQQTREKVDDKPRAQSSIRCVNGGRSRSSKLSCCPMAPTPYGACSRTSLRKPPCAGLAPCHHAVDRLGQMIKGGWTDGATIERQGTLRNSGIFAPEPPSSGGCAVDSRTKRNICRRVHDIAISWRYDACIISFDS